MSAVRLSLLAAYAVFSAAVLAYGQRRLDASRRNVRRCLITEAAAEEYSADLLLWDDEMMVPKGVDHAQP